MGFTDDDFDTFNDDYRFQELMQDAEMVRTPVSFDQLKFSENGEAFEFFLRIRDGHSYFYADFGINNGNPYYLIDNSPKPVKLYLNKGIIEYIYSWIQKGIKPAQIPDLYNIDKNADENYRLNLLKRDNLNKATHYNPKDGYKALYMYGRILYGKLPYTVEELKAKLNSLP